MYYEKTYVTMDDTFMSDWGRSEGKTNKLIFECDNKQEAEIVAENAKRRGDQRNIHICGEVPFYHKDKFYVQHKTKEDYPKWYRENAF